MVSMGSNGRGRVNGLGLAGLNNFIRPWSWGLPLVVWYLALGPLGEVDSSQKSESLIKEVVGYGLWIG